MTRIGDSERRRPIAPLVIAVRALPPARVATADAHQDAYHAPRAGLQVPSSRLGRHAAACDERPYTKGIGRGWTYLLVAHRLAARLALELDEETVSKLAYQGCPRNAARKGRQTPKWRAGEKLAIEEPMAYDK